MLANFAKGTNLATGKYITYISSDDYLIYTSFISEAISRIFDNPSVTLVHGINLVENTHTDELFIDSSYIFYKNSFYKKSVVSGLEVFLSYPLCHSISFGGTLFNRKILLAMEPFTGKITSGDAQVILKMLLECDAIFIDKKTYVARVHDSNESNKKNATMCIENIDYINVPYQYAKSKNYLDNKLLIEWRKNMYVNYFTECILNLYKTNINEYKIFQKYA
jgi:hypothetical protein